MPSSASAAQSKWHFLQEEGKLPGGGASELSSLELAFGQAEIQKEENLC